MKSGCRDVDRLEKLECDGASAVGNGEVTQKMETVLELKSLLLSKKRD